jgi:hypothetical protein
MLLHLVAHTLPGTTPFIDAELAAWMWRRLRRCFPHAIAACVMPDHLHTIVEDGANASRGLAALLSGAARHFGEPRLWKPVPAAKPIPNVQHLKREIRYIHLNPCRARIVADPLMYPWSTHRGAIGAELDPWVTIKRLARACHWSVDAELAQRFHAYVSGDPTVHPNGSSFPRPAPPRELPAVPLALIVEAAHAATPWSTPAERRRVIAGLAWHQGWRDTDHIARAAEITLSAARRVLQRALSKPALIEPALLCLGDKRLRTPPPRTRI